MNQNLLKFALMPLGQVAIFAIIIGFIHFQFAYDDGSLVDKQIATVQAEILTERQKEKQSDEALAKVQQLKDSYLALTEQFKFVSAQIPTDLQMAEIIKTVDTMAKTSGIVIKSKEPKTSSREDILEVYPLHMTAEGTFSELTMFFYNLSSIERIYRVKSFTFSSQSDRKTNRLTLDAELTSFRFIGLAQMEKERKAPVQ